MNINNDKFWKLGLLICICSIFYSPECNCADTAKSLKAPEQTKSLKIEELSEKITKCWKPETLKIHKSTAKFKIIADKTGQISKIETVTSSSSPQFDTLAYHAIQSAAAGKSFKDFKEGYVSFRYENFVSEKTTKVDKTVEVFQPGHFDFNLHL